MEPTMFDDVCGTQEALVAPLLTRREAAYAAMQRDRRSTGLYVAQPAFATIEEIRHADELRLRLRMRLLVDAPPAKPWSVGVE
jgi:hypothetical protein